MKEMNESKSRMKERVKKNKQEIEAKKERNLKERVD